MGFRTGFVLTSVSFLYGVLFVASIYDFPLLYGKSGKEEYDAAEQFYLTLYNGPTAISALLHGTIGLGILGLVAKIHRWTETAKWFDGFSLCLLMSAIFMYAGVLLPNIRLLADPSNIDLLLRSSIRTQREAEAKAQIKAGLLAADAVVDLGAKTMTGVERESALKILAAGNTIVMVLLAGVYLMQGSEWWIERGERMEEEEKRESEMKALGLDSGSSSVAKAEKKKTQ